MPGPSRGTAGALPEQRFYDFPGAGPIEASAWLVVTAAMDLRGAGVFANFQCRRPARQWPPQSLRCGPRTDPPRSRAGASLGMRRLTFCRLDRESQREQLNTVGPRYIPQTPAIRSASRFW